MEEEKRGENIDDNNEQGIQIPEQGSEIFEVDVKEAEAKEIAEQKGAEELKKQIERLLTDKGNIKIGEASNLAEGNFREKSARVKETGVIKKMGTWVGRTLGWVVGSLESKVKKFDIETFGTENLKELEGKPYILAANHIKPKNILMRAIGLSSDSFAIKRVVQEESQRMPNAIANVSGKIRKIPVLGHLDKIWSPFREGMMEGAGFIPVKMRRKGEQVGFNRSFVENFRSAVERKEPVIIFPQGQWDNDFNSDREFETGTATLASRYNLPIVPIYINGGRTWSSKEKVSVSIGQAIDPAGKDKEGIMGEIKGSLTDMQEAREKNNSEKGNE